MEKGKINVVKIISYDEGMLSVDRYRSCEIILASRGLVRTTFTKGLLYSDDLPGVLPVKEIYEYQLKTQKLQQIFSKFDLSKFSPKEKHDPPENGKWEMHINTLAETKKIRGLAPPRPYGEEFADAIKQLLPYKVTPFIF